MFPVSANRGRSAPALLATGVAALVGLAAVAGYLSSATSAAVTERVTPAPAVLTARNDIPETVRHNMPAPPHSAGAVVDPLAEYRETIGLIRHDYYGGPVSDARARELTYEAIRGMLGSLRDQFTSFLDPGEWSRMQATTDGDYEGVGALVETRAGGQLTIVRAIEGSPALKAGLKPGDEIVSLAGRPVRGRSADDVVNMMQGDPGSRIRIGVIRDGKPREFVIVRGLVEPRVVEHWMEDSQYRIGHIVLTEFNEKSIGQLEQAFHDLENDKMRALVFDLRGNPGGLLDTAVSVASMFIAADHSSAPKLGNNVVLIREASGEQKGLKLQAAQHTHGQLPLVVLVNGTSASAAEIVAAAIKDYGAGTIMGVRTFGKGRVQTLFPMDDRSALRLTTALYYPPKGYDINFKRDEGGNRIEGTGGIIPDIEIHASPQWSEEFRDKANDSQLHAALRYLRSRLDGRSPEEATAAAQAIPPARKE